MGTIWRAAREGLEGGLPARYRVSWAEPFYESLQDVLVPGCSVLDVGSGAMPTIPIEKRPQGCRYVGLDIDPSELDKAPEGSYDETLVADLGQSVPELNGRFDAIVSQFVFEHVRPLEVVLENLRGYLRPGGVLVSYLSGGRSFFAILNRLIPKRIALWVLKLIGRDPGTVFKAYYDQCSYTALDRVLSGWSDHQVIPRYLGANYFKFFRPFFALYLAYEEWTVKSDRKNLASYYFIMGKK